MNNAKYDGILYPVKEVYTLKELVYRSTKLYKDKTAYLEKDKPGGTFQPITYGQVRDDIDALGTRLMDMGLYGKKIAVIGESSYRWLLAYYAAVCGVGVVVPLDKNLPPNEIKNLVKRSGASALFFSKSAEKSIKDLFDEPFALEYFISISDDEHEGGNRYSMEKLIAEGRKLIKGGVRDFVDADVEPDQLASLIYTSGTTGTSKGVMLSHRNIAANVYNMSRLVKIPEKGIVLSILPIHHAYEMTCGIWTTFYQGRTIAICEGIKYIQKNLVEVKANVMLGVPLVFEKMYKGMWKQAKSQGEEEKLRKAIDLSRKLRLYNNKPLMKKLFKAIHQSFGNNIDLLVAGGAAIDPKVIEDFEAMGFPMIQGYGMSENAPIIAVNQDRYSKAAAVGRPMPETEVKIVDKSDDGIGEVLCKGPSVMMGYYDNDEATAEVLKDGWLSTGDLGYMDDDGFIYLTGRKKTVIVTKGGKNIFPEEIETVLMENQYIQEVMVHGVVDKRVGNVMVTADIFPNMEKLAADNGDMDDSDIYHFFKKCVDEANGKMPSYKAVKRINIRKTEFDKTTTGKIKRYGNKTKSENMEDTTSMSYQEIKAAEIKRAQEFAQSLKDSDDKYVTYRTSRPITDIKNMFETSVELYGDNVAFRQRFKKGEPFTPVTYKQALADVNGLGTALINRGLKGKRIAIIGETCYQWESSYLAVLNGTGIVVPLDKELSANELEQLVIEAEVSAVIFGKKYEEMFTEMKDSGRTGLDMLVSFDTEEHAEKVLSWKQLIEEGKDQIAQGDRQFLDAEIIGDDMSILLFTSGTTGVAKAVMLSHYNLAFDLMSAPTILNVNPWDIFFSVLPVHHTYECTCAFLMPLYKGASIAYCEGLKYITKNLEEVKPTMILGVPVLIETLYKKIWKNVRAKGKEKTLKTLLSLNRKTKKIGLDISKPFTKEILEVFGGNMRVIISGGAAINPEILEFFNDIGIVGVQGYGLTECAPMAALNPDTRKNMKLAAVGHLLPGMEVRVENANESGIGEICLKGSNVMMGYYNNPEATAEAIVDGWYHTGDLGYVDEDDFIFITGRQKNVIITKNGKNVYPEELEYHLGNVPYIAESMVWGADEEGGNSTSIIATVTLDAEEVVETLGTGYTEDQVKDLIWSEVDKINDQLPLFKKIKNVTIRKEDFEKTTGKKIKRFVDSNKEVSK